MSILVLFADSDEPKISINTKQILDDNNIHYKALRLCYKDTSKINNVYNCLNPNTGLPRNVSWSKLLALYYALSDKNNSEYEYIMYLDKSIIINENMMNIKLDKNYDLYFRAGKERFDTRMMIFKNSDKNKLFLKKWYNSNVSGSNNSILSERSVLFEDNNLLINCNITLSYLNEWFTEDVTNKTEYVNLMDYMLVDTSALIGEVNHSVKVLIGTPAFGAQVSSNYTSSLLETTKILTHFNIENDVSFINNQLTTRARNLIAHTFITSTFTDLFFIDADIQWTPVDFVNLLNMEKDFCCGLYCNKGYHYNKESTNLDNIFQTMAYSSVFNNNNKITDINNDKIMEIKYAAGGFTKIRKDVFLQLIPFTDSYLYDNSVNLYDFFQCRVMEKQYLTEDYFICYQWKKHCNGKIWTDLKINLNHEGWHSYEGNPLKSMKVY